MHTRKYSQTQSPNSISIAGNIVLAGVVFGAVSPYLLFVSIPLILIGLTAESRLKSQ